MVLSRNDKIITVSAVVILIVAAFAIVLYQEPAPEITITPMTKTYDVIWTRQTGQKTITNLYAEKKKPYNGNFSVDVPEGSVLTSADVQITWKDDHIYGLILKRGYDTLTVKISLGGKTELYSDKGSGNKTFTFNINDIPTVDSVEANDTTAAEDIINDMFSDKNSASFDVTASVKTGERIIRLLKFLKDKGNGFNLKVTYEYYTPMIEESGEELPPEEPPAKETSYLGRITSIGNFGRI
ncbi:MAG: hypothetical protein QHH19_01335 [Candidatus Thermoplasmatota archaeon]|jgi:hypothetical protein|nr:hypothetical protein [Candidatus Thermoplasmatota archaeon]